MSAICKDIQDAVTAYLAARAELTGVGVIGRRKNTIVSDIAAQINKLGSCIYVFPALPVQVNSNNPGPYVDKLLIRCRAIEHPSLNRTGPDAYELVELLLRLLDAAHFTAIESLQPLRFEAQPVQIVDDAEELIQFDVVAFTSCGLTPRT